MDKIVRSPKGLCMFAPVTLMLAATFSVPAMADESGVPFWVSGQYASFAAVPATPGWAAPMQGYYYNGSASRTKTFPSGGIAAAGLRSSVPLLLVQPTFAPETKLWGGQLALGLGFGFGSNTTDADLALSSLGTEFNRSDSVTGSTDLYPIISLAWNKGNDNWMTYVTGNIPTGDYSPDRLANIGIGHGAIDAGGAYTYFDQAKGREFSVVMGLTYNMENQDTNYQNGIDMHIDWAASQFLDEHWQVGVVGYAYNQLTDDSGSGNNVGAFKSSIAAIGPQIGYAFTVNGQPAYANLRGYWEFAAVNRIEGGALFATLSIPLGRSGTPLKSD